MVRVEREKARPEELDMTAADVESVARDTADLKLSSAVCLRAYRMMMDGNDFKDGHFVGMVQLAELWDSMDWWQMQVDVTQRAITRTEEDLRDAAKVYAEMRKSRNKNVQAGMYESYISNEQGNLKHYKVWQQVCISSMRRLSFWRKAKVHGQVE